MIYVKIKNNEQRLKENSFKERKSLHTNRIK